MKAVILAAGKGRRLSSVTQLQPKCLLEFGGRSLLARYLESLHFLGVMKVVLVVGYEQEKIRLAVQSYQESDGIRFVINEDFQRGSIGSLWAVRHELDDDVVIMDADVLFHTSMLYRLINSPHPNAILVDETVIQEDEECMAVIRGGRVVALTKQVPRSYDWLGEGVGFLKLSKGAVPQLLHSVEQCVHKGMYDMEYEDALQEFFVDIPVGYEKIGGLPWIEIDYPEDLTRAQQEILPQLKYQSLSAGPGGLDGIIDRYVNRRISRFFTKFFIFIGLSPNVVTMISMFIGLAGAVFFAFGSYHSGVIGALLFQLSVIIDCCDGEIARLTYSESKFGQELDILADNLVHMAIFSGIAWGVFVEDARPHYYLPLILGAIAVVANVFCLLLVNKVRYLKTKSVIWSQLPDWQRTRLEFIFNHVVSRDFSVIVLLFSCFGLLPWFLWVGAVGSCVFALALVLILALPQIFPSNSSSSA